MSADPKALDITILGRDYRIACAEGERQQLLDAVSYLDRKMREIKDSGKVVGADRIAVMAALNIAHELLTTRIGGGFDMGELKRRIADMQAVIDEALAEQDRLF
ncbi:MAG: cell division protein ZapA [Betaproteobacteria bacterium]|nr:cell division protein ZapA [Betaproteobacteria bacterium]